MGDNKSPLIAEGIYSYLFRDRSDSEFLDPGDVLYALDDALRKLRTSGIDPSIWETYVDICI
jgi:hypothetical protein